MKPLEVQSTKLALPSGGYTILVRDGIPYQTWSEKAWFVKMGESPNSQKRLMSDDIKDSDIIYHFPDSSDIVASLNNGRCLNKFLLRREDKLTTDKLKELLVTGRNIGFVNSSYNRYAVSIKNNKIYWSLRKDNGLPNEGSLDNIMPDWKFYEFKDTFELGHWIHGGTIKCD